MSEITVRECDVCGKTLGFAPEPPCFKDMATNKDYPSAFLLEHYLYRYGYEDVCKDCLRKIWAEAREQTYNYFQFLSTLIDNLDT